MAGLGYAQHRSSGLQDDFRDFDPEDAFEVSHNRRDDARPRIGTGARLRPPRRKAADGLLLWRALATSASVLILGMGGLVAYHAIGSGIPASSTSASPQPAPAQQPPALKTVERGHAQMATKVASILGAPSSSAPAVPPQSAGTVQMAAASPAPAEPAPTAADFARPAFLEPVGGDEPGDEASLPEGATQTVSDTAPTGAAPLPKAKPRAVAVASSDAGPAAAGESRTARIRSDVTLRSGPKRSASIVGTLSEGTKVTLYSCKSWCEVSSGDKRGFVYKAAVAQ